MNNLAAFTVGALALCVSTTANAGETVSQSYDFKGFDAVDISGVYELEIEVGSDFSIELSGRPKDMERVKVSVRGGALQLGQKQRLRGEKRRKQDGIMARITLPDLIALDASGVVDGSISGVDSDDLKLDISGVGDLTLSGVCGRMDADVSGVGDLDAGALKCQNVDVTVSGVGEATVFASEAVDARVSGMGDITVYGSPKQVKKRGGIFADISIK